MTASFYDHLARATLESRVTRGRMVQTSAGEVHVLQAEGYGTLPPLVLLHGFSSAGVHFFPILGRLRRSVRRLILPDMPAHGFSATPRAGISGKMLRAGMREALNAVIDAPVVLFGNSMGGVAAIEYALHRPERVLGLLLVLADRRGDGPRGARRVHRLSGSATTATRSRSSIGSQPTRACFARSSPGGSATSSTTAI